MGYHEYGKILVPIVGETLHCQMELENIVDKYPVAASRKAKFLGIQWMTKLESLRKLYFFPESWYN